MPLGPLTRPTFPHGEPSAGALVFDCELASTIANALWLQSKAKIMTLIQNQWAALKTGKLDFIYRADAANAVPTARCEHSKDNLTLEIHENDGHSINFAEHGRFLFLQNLRQVN